MSNEPKLFEKIYLQNFFEDFGFYDEGVTWCSDKQNDDDIEYILLSKYDQLKAENERLREALKTIVTRYDWSGESPVSVRELADVASQALKDDNHE